jgi:hypothetical protein
MKIILEDNLILQNGNKAITSLIVPDENPSIPEELILSEISCNPVAIEGFILKQEELTENGIKSIQEFILSPDLFYTLYETMKELDKQ